MVTRRGLLLGAGALTLAALTLFNRPAAAQSGDAAGFVARAANEMIAAMDHAPNEAAERQSLQQIVDRTVDVDGIARFCLGRFWRVATPAQQKQYLALFHRSLMNSIIARLGDYKGVQLVTGRSVPTDEGTLVASTITRPGQPPVQAQWLIATVGGVQKVTDVVAEGTSLRVTQRSDYTSFLDQHNGNVQALLDGLARQDQQARGTQ